MRRVRLSVVGPDEFGVPLRRYISSVNHLFPSREGSPSQDAIILGAQQMSASGEQIVHLPMDTQKPLCLS